MTTIKRVLLMQASTASYSINGEEPQIVGCRCTGFYLMQHQEAGVISDPANVAYFNFPCGWVRLYFDGNTIFWRSSIQPPVQPVNGDYASVLALIDLSELTGIVGAVLNSIEYCSLPCGVGVTLVFNSGSEISLFYLSADDKTVFRHA